MPKYRLYLICIFLYVDRMVSILSHIWKICTQFCLSVYILENMEQGKSIFQHISHSDKHKQKQEIVMKTLILMNLTPPSIIDNTLIRMKPRLELD